MLLIALSVRAESNVARPELLPEPFRPGEYVGKHGETHRYAVFVPRNYTPDRQWPVMLFLHGASEKGNDGWKQVTLGLGPALKKQPDFPFIVVFPQCEDVDGRYLTGWLSDTPDAQRALRILESVENQYRVDPQHRVLCGWSMGGYGAWSLAAADPEHWSAVMPFAGGGDPETVQQLADSSTPVWAIHGAEDGLVPADRSSTMVNAVTERGGKAYFTSLPDIGHDVCPVALLNPAVTQWLLDPAAVDPASVSWDEAIRESKNPLGDVAQFHPFAEIPNVLAVRLGNHALRTVSQGLPTAIPPEMLKGSLGDITRTFGEGQQRIDVRMSGGRYECSVADCRIHAVSGGWLHVEFAFQPIRLEFDGSSLVGPEVDASTGPIAVTLGHRHPVTLALDLRPQATDEGVQFKVLRQSFHMDDDNWFVSAPAGIEVRRGEYLPRHIKTGIVGGLYLNRDSITKQVLSVVPGLLESIEQRMNSVKGDDLAGSVWPLPALAPKLQLKPASIRTDADGISVLLNVEVGHVHGEPANSVAQLVAAQVDLGQLHDSRELTLLASLDLIEAMSAAVVSEGTARINVLDVPEPLFARLCDPAVVGTHLPGMPDDPDRLRTIVSLVEPFRIDLQETRDDSAEATLSTNGFAVTFQHRDADSRWKTITQLKCALVQGMQFATQPDDKGETHLEFRWSDSTELNVLEVQGQEMSSASADELRRKILAAWQGWIGSQPSRATMIPSLKLGDAVIPWAGLDWEKEALTMQEAPVDRVRLRYETPVSRVSNDSDRILLYELQRPSSDWTGPHVLLPGAAEEYHAGYDLHWRVFQSRDVPTTLRAGESLSFRGRNAVRVANRATTGMQE